VSDWMNPSNDPTAAVSAGRQAPRLLDLPGRPEWPLHAAAGWFRHPLETIDEEMVTGLGAATELPTRQWWGA
jgi:hypothetical protein